MPIISQLAFLVFDQGSKLMLFKQALRCILHRLFIDRKTFKFTINLVFGSKSSFLSIPFVSLVWFHKAG